MLLQRFHKIHNIYDVLYRMAYITYNELYVDRGIDMTRFSFLTAWPGCYTLTSLIVDPECPPSLLLVSLLRAQLHKGSSKYLRTPLLDEKWPEHQGNSIQLLLTSFLGSLCLKSWPAKPHLHSFLLTSEVLVVIVILFSSRKTEQECSLHSFMGIRNATSNHTTLMIMLTI